MGFRDLPNYMEIVRAVAAARKEAWNNASRESVEIIDAEIFLASFEVLINADLSVEDVSPPPESQPLTEPPSPPVEVTPEPEPEPPEEPMPPPHSGKKKRKK